MTSQAQEQEQMKLMELLCEPARDHLERFTANELPLTRIGPNPKLAYELLQPGSCGFLYPESPVKGLCLSSPFFTPFEIVLYCPELRRVTVSSAAPPDEQSYNAFREHLDFLTGGTPHCSIVVKIFVPIGPGRRVEDDFLANVLKHFEPIVKATRASLSPCSALEMIRGKVVIKIERGSGATTVIPYLSEVSTSVLMLAYLTSENIQAAICLEYGITSQLLYRNQLRQQAFALPKHYDGHQRVFEGRRDDGTKDLMLLALKDSKLLESGVSKSKGPQGYKDTLCDYIIKLTRMPLVCEVCLREAKAKCGGCDFVTYCGVEHQKQDHAAHKKW